MPPQEAILLIAHGSRRKEANDDLRTMADHLRSRIPDTHIEVAYLELTEPTIPQGARACIEAGAAKVYLLPFFLSPGIHVVQDLEEFREEFRQQWPEQEFAVCPPLGVHPHLVEILLTRLAEAKGIPA